MLRDRSSGRGRGRAMPHCRVQSYPPRVARLLLPVATWVIFGGSFEAVAGPPSNPSCPGTVDCCVGTSAETTSPGCSNEVCCERVCACDPFCCETDWDELCAGNGADDIGCGAAVLCSDLCAPPLGACCTPDDTCVDLTEEECRAVPPVYEPRLWQAGELCGVGGQTCPNSRCIGRTGDCLEGHDRICDGGFNDGQQCVSDSGCRSRCVSYICDPGGGACIASNDCNDDGDCVFDPNGTPVCEGGARDGEFCDPDHGDHDCLEAFCRLRPGCAAPWCCTAVCDYAPGFPLYTEFCCQTEWDSVCAELARLICRGACCVEDPVEAVCSDGSNFDECSAVAGTLFLDQSCSELGTAGGCPGLGACCDRSVPGGQCTSPVPQSQCDTANPQIVWYVGENCVEDGGTVDCLEHTGACCDRSVPGGSCASGVPESACDTTNPQVLWFKGEDCAKDGGTIECLEHTGACCDGNSGTCTDDVPESQCDTSDPQFTWFAATACDALDPPCAQHRGACCDRIAGVCIDDVLPDDCRNVNPGDQLTWFKSMSCSEVDCSEAVGACCDHNAGPLAEIGLCTNGVAFAECQCSTCEWSKGRTCDEIIREGSCEADFAAIPAVSEWGLVILTLLLLTAAKVHGYWRTTAPDAR